MTASECVAAALALEPTLGDHAVIPGSVAPSPELDTVWELLVAAVSADPALAVAHALRGNLLVRRGDTAGARRSYALAARLDAHDAPSRIALGELAFMAGAADESARWFTEAFARTRRFSPAPRTGTRSALVLMFAGPWPRSIPLDFVIDRAQWTLHRWYLPDPLAARDAARLRAYDVIINAIGESDDAHSALAAAHDVMREQTKPSLNDPERVRGTARSRIGDVLRDVAGCTVAPSRRVTRDEFMQLAIEANAPLLVRPADTHGGGGLERIDDAAALAAYAKRTIAPAYDAGPFVDYRDAAGYYRKFRIMYVNGEPFPYHLAIDTEWMIHYHRAPMASHAWMREEEERFLRDPEHAFPGWNGVVRAVGAAVGLDYFGIDCTLLSDGTLFIFEADAAMLVHGFDPAPAKRAAYARIRTALDTFLTRSSAVSR